MVLARQVKEKHGIKNIYLATDEPSIFKEIEEFSNEFSFFYLEATKGSDYAKSEYRWNKETPMQLTNNLLLDLYLLSECKVFVGAQRSMLGWLASR